MVYITASGATTVVDGCRSILIQVNGALTGTITCAGAVGGTFAIITNPGVGNVFRYGGLRGNGAITVNPSATTDISVTIDPRDI